MYYSISLIFYNIINKYYSNIIKIYKDIFYIYKWYRNNVKEIIKLRIYIIKI